MKKPLKTRMQNSRLNPSPRLNPFGTLLKEVATPDVVGGLYYAGRLLQRRQDVRDIHQGFRVPGVASEPSDKDQTLALKLLDQIEKIERRPVQSLSDRQAAKYINRFGNIIARRTRAQYGYDPEHGRALLAALRSTGANTGI